ncbi:hypothetical protein V6N13_033538 [Hibiscus sabdariffa]|uniref:Uncharacterized protein n=1 Tax=Hibiscus sabdariffa TaxID=183260 RepID=A0ABR2FA60_9ROSI
MCDCWEYGVQSVKEQGTNHDGISDGFSSPVGASSLSFFVDARWLPAHQHGPSICFLTSSLGKIQDKRTKGLGLLAEMEMEMEWIPRILGFESRALPTILRVSSRSKMRGSPGIGNH